MTQWPGRPRPEGRGLPGVRCYPRCYWHTADSAVPPQNPAGKPSFRSKQGTQGLVIRDAKVRHVNRNHAMVFVPKCGWVCFRLSRGPLEP